MRRHLVAAGVVIGLAACASDRVVEPAITPESTTTPKDTGTAVTLGYSAVSGRVLTTGATPVAGATVKLYHNVLVDGAGVSVYVTEAVSGADGKFHFDNVPFGYYLLRSGTNGLSYLAATTTTVTLDVWIQ